MFLLDRFDDLFFRFIDLDFTHPRKKSFFFLSLFFFDLGKPCHLFGLTGLSFFFRFGCSDASFFLDAQSFLMFFMREVFGAGKQIAISLRRNDQYRCDDEQKNDQYQCAGPGKQRDKQSV